MAGGDHHGVPVTARDIDPHELAQVMRFIGPNAEKFRLIYPIVADKRIHTMIFSYRYWNPVAAIFIYPWFMYCKLYAEAVGLFLAALAISVFYPETANGTVIGVSLLFLFFANGYYVDRAARKVREINRTAGTSDECDALMDRHGGNAKGRSCGPWRCHGHSDSTPGSDVD